MNYAKIREYDVTNGPGVRTTLFVSGCTHDCKGCFNKEQQNFRYGDKWTEAVEDKFIEGAKNPNIAGVSILGGEPMQQPYVYMSRLLKKINESVNKPIWVWTGYTFEELLNDKISKNLLKYIDVLIDGKFELDKRDLSLKYRGSSNQRVINVKESLKKNEIILYNIE